MNVILIEDNPETVSSVLRTLDQYSPEINVKGVAKGVQEGLKLINTAPADVWLVNLRFQDGSIFDLLDQVNPDLLERIALIFLSDLGYLDNMAQILSRSAIDYLPKPLSALELINGLHRGHRKLQQQGYYHQLDVLKNTINGLQRQQNGAHKLPVFLVKGEVKYLDIWEVIYLEGTDNITTIFLTERRSLLSVRNLGFYKNYLVQQCAFIPVSKKFVVNSRFIDRYKPGEGMVHLTNGDGLEASRRGKQYLMDYFRSLFELS